MTIEKKLEAMTKGWKEIQGATTQPKGHIWA